MDFGNKITIHKKANPHPIRIQEKFKKDERVWNWFAVKLRHKNA